MDNLGSEGFPSQAVIGTKVIPITVLAGFDLTNFSVLKNKKPCKIFSAGLEISFVL